MTLIIPYNDYEDFKKAIITYMEQLDEERDDITTYEQLKEFAKDKIDSDDLLVAIHILEALQSESVDWYEYDYCMGTLQTPSGITEKEHVEHMIEDEE